MGEDVWYEFHGFTFSWDSDKVFGGISSVKYSTVEIASSLRSSQ